MTDKRERQRKRRTCVAFYANREATEACPDLADQLLRLREVAVVHGWFVVAEYIDDRIPEVGRGPALERLVKDAVVRAFDVAACWSPEVLGRNSTEVKEVIAELRENRVAVFHLGNQEAISSIDRRRALSTDPTGSRSDAP